MTAAREPAPATQVEPVLRPPDEPRLRRGGTARWLSWLLGAAILGTVIVAALHLSEGREITEVVERANPWWIALAVVLQALTYVAQGEVFRGAPLAAGVALARSWLFQLSFTKLFLDQALPSAGVSSTVVIVRALRQRGVPRATAAACAMINLASYHAAYVIMLLLALGVSAVLGQINVVVLLISVLFLAFAVALTVAVLLLSGRPSTMPGPLARVPVVRNIAGFLRTADAGLTRSPRLLGAATAWQAIVFLLDAATMWVLIRAVGATAASDAVFASFMISSLFRTMGVVPGGLGTYEATSVLTLRMAGLSIPAALSATLAFRALTFWAPMLPGLWFSRRQVSLDVEPGTGDTG